jgi:hypothetical protein
VSHQLVHDNILAGLAQFAAVIRDHNASAPPELQIKNIDLDPSDPAPVVLPAEGIVGTLDKFGAAQLSGFNRYIADMQLSTDQWDQLWANQPNIARNFILPEFETLPHLTDDQRLSIRSNTANAGAKNAWLGSDQSLPEPWRHKVRCWPAFPITPNESGLGQIGTEAIPGTFAFCANSNPAHVMRAADGYGYGAIAKLIWLRGRPEWVRAHPFQEK